MKPSRGEGELEESLVKFRNVVVSLSVSLSRMARALFLEAPGSSWKGKSGNSIF